SGGSPRRRRGGRRGAPPGCGQAGWLSISQSEYILMGPRAYLLDLDGTLYSGEAAVPGAPAALARLRQQNIPYRLVTNTTSRSRAMLVKRLRDYGFAVSAEELFTATIAGADVARDAGYSCVAPFLPEPALVDMGDLQLCGGTSGQGSGRTPEAVLVGDLGSTGPTPCFRRPSTT